MKKIIALILLCLLLCAMGATAFAATVTVYDADHSKEWTPDNISGSTYTFPEYATVGFTPPEGKEFYGWKVYGITGNEAYFKPGSTIDIKDDSEIDVIAFYIDKDKTFYGTISP